MTEGRAWRATATAALCVLVVACRAPEAAPTGVTITRPSANLPFERTFLWKPVATATSYHVVVFSPEGTRAFEVRDLKTTGVMLSEGVKLPPGRYSVQVTAIRDGSPVAESPRTEFDIRN
jgi:hypothetical protein